MKFPDRETVARLRREFPAGCRVVLDEMDDPYVKIPVGTQGTCQGVDDAGSIMVPGTAAVPFPSRLGLTGRTVWPRRPR